MVGAFVKSNRRSSGRSPSDLFGRVQGERAHHRRVIVKVPKCFRSRVQTGFYIASVLINSHPLYHDSPVLDEFKAAGNGEEGPHKPFDLLPAVSFSRRIMRSVCCVCVVDSSFTTVCKCQKASLVTKLPPSIACRRVHRSSSFPSPQEYAQVGGS